MAQTRCPSCSRMLNVREEQIGLEARCPICGHTFTAEPEGGRALPYQRPVDAPDPSQPWRPGGSDRREVDALPTPPRDVDVPNSAEAKAADRVRFAGVMLLGWSICNLCWNLTCGCASFFSMLERPGLREVDTFIVSSLYLLHLAFQIVIMMAGQAMRNKRGRALSMTGIVLCLVEGLFLVGRGFLLLVDNGDAFGDRNGNELITGFNCLSLIISLVLFFAGLYGLRVMSNPAYKTREERMRIDED